jgi:hypothetical protein
MRPERNTDNDKAFTYKRITRRKPLNPEVPACGPVRWWNSFLGWLLFLLDVDVRVHALQAAAPVSIMLLMVTHVFHLLPGMKVKTRQKGGVIQMGQLSLLLTSKSLKRRTHQRIIPLNPT